MYNEFLLRQMFIQTSGEANIIDLAFGVLLSCGPVQRMYNLYCLRFFPKSNGWNYQ